jgi:hypothetical protein
MWCGHEISFLFEISFNTTKGAMRANAISASIPDWIKRPAGTTTPWSNYMSSNGIPLSVISIFSAYHIIRQGLVIGSRTITRNWGGIIPDNIAKILARSRT